MNLKELGFNDFFEKHFEPFKNNYHAVGRIAEEHKSAYRIFTENGMVTGRITGRLRFDSRSTEELPAVGDWVVLNAGDDKNSVMIKKVLPRFSKFSRNSAGDITEEQIVAANVNIVFIVASLNQELNVPRIERYLTMVWNGGGQPVILLNKIDLCDDVEARVREVENSASGVNVHAMSAVLKTGFECFGAYLKYGETVAFLGSSGVGKTTIINVLLGRELLKVGDISGWKDRGRHTTNVRQMVVLGSGGILIDTPGMREIQLWEGSEEIERSFDDIEELALSCRFGDCRHDTEPGCAVKKAIQDGSVSEKRVKNYLKLKREISVQEKRKNIREKILEKKQNKRKTMKNLDF